MKRKEPKFRLVVTMGDETHFISTNKEKEVDDIVNLFHDNPNATSIQIYSNDGEDAYSLICTDHKRKIGFR